MGTAAIRSREGSALVIVLALLVLMTGIVLAFFSRAVDQRRVSAVSAADSETRLFADSAAEMVVGDLRQEMAAGSLPDPMKDPPAQDDPSIARITDPEIVTIAGQSIAPGIVPQKVASDGLNIVKKSRDERAFYTAAGWYASATSTKPTPADGPVRASSVSTSTASLKGRAISLERWKLPKLLTPTEEGTFAAPDWIYVNRSGANPADLSAAGLPALANSSPDNTNHVIGRYAYVVYDLGGLMDINVVGNALTADENARRGGLHQVSLAGGLAGVSIPNFTDFVAWRSAASQANADATPGGGGLFDPQRTFLQVEAGDQAFLNRQDLIKYTEPAGSLIPSALLPYLTTFTRDFNGPVLRPDPLRSKTLDLRFPPPTPPTVDEINPDALTVRFGTETKLSRGSVDPATVPTVPAGTSVMPRKFPLSKINLLAEDTPNAAVLKYYFGLEKRADGVLEYVASGTGGKILTMAEVAALPPDAAGMKREPNFFEVLQASILTGSLAKSAPNTYNYEETSAAGPGPDTLHRLQIFRIGANIIDQWDADNAPTRIESPSVVAGDPQVIFGIENLPYVSQISVVGYRPKNAKETFQVWAVFDVWNPHQNAKPQSGKPPTGVTGFRIVPVSGEGRVILYYNPSVFYPDGDPRVLIGKYDTTKTLSTRSLMAENAGRDPLIFSGTGNYSEPKRIGLAPDSGGGAPGILLNEDTVLVSIPPRGARGIHERGLQVALNGQMIRPSPLVPAPPIDPASGPNGEYVYPSGTVFTTLDPLAWEKMDTGSEILVWAKYGVKAYNYLRLWPSTAKPYVFDVQAEIGGKWVTTQRLDGWVRNSDGPMNPTDGTRDQMLENTDHLMHPDRNLLKGFYTWMARGGSCGMIRSDPRTTRLGSSGVNAWQNHPSDPALNDFTGLSVRSSTDAVLTPVNSDMRRQAKDWLAGSGNAVSGISSGVAAAGFEFADATKYARPYTVPSISSYTFGYAANTPDALNAAHPMRYSDPDEVIRPGDAYFGGYPLVPGHLADRPLVLNRPFRSVAEMGYAFRDVPWKTLDFSTRRSGDLGLLGAFSISDPEADPPVVAGKVNLNTPHAEVLSAVMQGTARQLPGMDGSLIASDIDATTADAVADAIVTESRQRPFLNSGDLITRVLNPATGSSPLTDVVKSRREAAVRALAGVGSTRTWNFLIDVIAQTGRFTQRSSAAGDFMVQGETHLWVQVAMDRFTGQVVAKQVEVVND